MNKRNRHMEVELNKCRYDALKKASRKTLTVEKWGKLTRAVQQQKMGAEEMPEARPSKAESGHRHLPPHRGKKQVWKSLHN